MKTKVMILLVLAAGTAMAQRGDGNRQPPSAEELIERLDKDDDGKISEDEFDGPSEHFSELDKDSDGYLSESEAPSGPPPRGRR